jgi:SlyX protein
MTQTTEQQFDNRTTELEIRLTHFEDTIEVLNQTIIKQSDEINILQLQVSLLEKKIKTSQSSPVALESEETPPPHY